MLFKIFNKSYWYIGIFLYAIIGAMGTKSEVDYFFLATAVVPFLCFGIAMYELSTKSIRIYTPRNLFVITLLYSLFVVFCYHQLSLYVDGDQFLFSKADAARYQEVATRLSNTSFDNWLQLLKETGFGIDDWGAFLFLGGVYSIWQSPTFLAIVYCVIGAFTALNIFYIGRSVMCRRYAFFAALSLALSSFTITYYGMFLKETIMIFVIILSFRFFYAYINTRNISYLILAFLTASFIFFFRTPVALIAMMSFAITLTIKYVNKVVLPFVLIGGLALMTTTSAFMYSYDRYLRGGDTEQIIERKNSLAMGGGIINQITDPIAAFFGPFPSVVVGKNAVSILNSSGLIFRMLLVLPFVFGVYYTIRYQRSRIYPLVLFFIVNALGVAISVKGLEVRLSLPHLFTAYLIAFWWMAHYDYHRFRIKLSNKQINLYIACVVGMCFLWNLRSLI